jgi:hypothetical protein
MRRNLIVWGLFFWMWSNLYPMKLVMATDFPAGGAYKLDGFAFGGGAVSSGTSPNYQYQVRTGQLDNNMMTSPSFDLGAGLAFERQSPVPNASTLSNPGSYPDKLLMVIDNRSGGSTLPSDTKFVIAISSDDFATIKYVSSVDHSILSSYSASDYQTYAQLGGVDGINILGLTAGLTYKVKVRSMQGNFSESAWGPISAGVATVNPALTF